MFISTRRRIYGLNLIIGDIICIIVSFSLATMIRFGPVHTGDYILSNIFPLLVNVLVFIAIFYLAGLYEPHRFNNYFRVVTTVLLSVLSGMLFSSFMFYADYTLKIGRGIFILSTIFICTLMVVSRLIFLLVSRKKILDKKIIIVGTGEAAKDAVVLVKDHPTSFYNIVGIIKEGKHEVENNRVGGHEILGTINEIAEIVKSRKVDAIVVTTLEPERHRILGNLRGCRYRGIEIIDLVSLYEELELQVPLKYIDDEWLYSSSSEYPGFHIRKIKRLMDIVISIIGIIVSIPIAIVVAILIKLDSKGPILYVQKRVGRFSKPFRVIKFRSMIHRAERGAGGPVWSTEKDTRITGVGKWLRRLRIDEVPQLINILFGHMSLVGPRPERKAFVNDLSEKIPFYPERLYAQPGLTGWAQINYAYTSDVESSIMKLQYDLYYIKHVSFFLDCLILFKTLKIVFLGKGR